MRFISNSALSIKAIFALLSCFFGLNLQVYAQNTGISKVFLIGRDNYATDTSFINVSNSYTNNLVYLKKDTYRNYIKMYDAALKENIKLTIISGTRSFFDQRDKWQSKWNNPEFNKIHDPTTRATKLLRWWSMPGTSRHHWGTEIDIVNMKLAFYKTAAGRKMYTWMCENASKYGFYQPFNAGRTTGYQEEKWHWSYLPLSKVYLKEYLKQVHYSDIAGFPGCAEASKLAVFESQVLAINPICK
jgi:D-alanyl-D-alanine carboxypeptidase